MRASELTEKQACAVAHGMGIFRWSSREHLDALMEAWPMNSNFQTPDDVAASMSTTSGAMSAAEWSDFFSMPFEQQKACAQMYKGAIFDAQGPSGWDTALGILGTAATVFGEASGIGTALQALRSL